MQPWGRRECCSREEVVGSDFASAFSRSLAPRAQRRLCRAAMEALEERQLLAHFAVIGDFSSNLQTPPTRDVANLVKGWNPDFVATVGDNNYPDGAASTIDSNVGQWYHQFIS